MFQIILKNLRRIGCLDSNNRNLWNLCKHLLCEVNTVKINAKTLFIDDFFFRWLAHFIKKIKLFALINYCLWKMSHVFLVIYLNKNNQKMSWLLNRTYLFVTTEEILFWYSFKYTLFCFILLLWDLFIFIYNSAQFSLTMGFKTLPYKLSSNSTGLELDDL